MMEKKEAFLIKVASVLRETCAPKQLKKKNQASDYADNQKKVQQ